MSTKIIELKDYSGLVAGPELDELLAVALGWKLGSDEEHWYDSSFDGTEYTGTTGWKRPGRHCPECSWWRPSSPEWNGLSHLLGLMEIRAHHFPAASGTFRVFKLITGRYAVSFWGMPEETGTNLNLAVCRAACLAILREGAVEPRP